jgi:hypothetical protein
MIRVQNAVNPATRRIGQLIRMLSSDQPGEAAAAAQALNRTLASAGLDIHALADAAERGLQLPLLMEQSTGRSRSATTKTKALRPDGRPQMGERLVCDQPGGVFHACRCEDVFTVMPGVGQHVAQLVCDDCGNGGRWLGHQHFFNPI